MIATSIRFGGLLLLSSFLISCSPRLVGTWTVDRYETISPGEHDVTLRNIGTIRFRKNGSGEKKLNYTVLGVTQDDKTPFKWSWIKDQYVSIESKGSDFSKTWIVIENKKKYQKWKSTEGTNIQVLELKK